ncbi:TPA: hypothetical protein NJ353_000357 [Vibrio parahaemolyticus]|nr:hypothetical protein [Vibrio parahaemolyticus]HCH0721973.1 hypothetical protein [Vibrio parahaemolyticus]HCH1050505.1 hypothetical protein [Vibrio parahaemolyticus]
MLFLLLVGCQTTSGDSRYSPTATNVQIEKVGVYVPNDFRTEKNVIDGINDQGTKAVSLSRTLEFVKNESEVPMTLKANGITHVFVVTGNIGREDIRYAGSINNSNTNVTSLGAGYATANTSSFSTPIYFSNNYAAVNGKLYQTGGDLVWVTDIELEAEGTIYTGAKAMSEGVAKGLVDEMKKSGLLAIE